MPGLKWTAHFSAEFGKRPWEVEKAGCIPQPSENFRERNLGKICSVYGENGAITHWLCHTSFEDPVCKGFQGRRRRQRSVWLRFRVAVVHHVTSMSWGRVLSLQKTLIEDERFPFQQKSGCGAVICIQQTLYLFFGGGLKIVFNDEWNVSSQ